MSKSSVLLKQILVASALAGCGGSAKQNLEQVAPPVVNPTAPPVVISRETTYPGGIVGDVVYNHPLPGGSVEIDAVLLADAAAADYVFAAISDVASVDGGLSISRTNSNISAVDSEAVVSGTDAYGNEVRSAFYLIRLPTEGYVSANITKIEGLGYGLVTDGYSPSGTAPATATYSGSLLIGSLDAGSVLSTEFGTFDMTVDFAAQNASLNGTTETGSIAAPRLVLNENTIESAFFGSAQLSMAARGPAVEADVFGVFAGANAEGVHGLAHETNREAGPLSAAFFGKAN